jgi:hypothetical protein
VFDEFSSVHQRNETRKCSECLGPAGRYKQAELLKGQNSEHPRWSWSMGCTAVQAKEVLKDHPELEGDFKHGKNGGPLLVHNRQDKLRKMSIFGMQEY